MATEANTTTAAGIPAEREEFGLQEEPVFAELSEHSVCDHSQIYDYTITLPLSTNRMGDFHAKRQRCMRRRLPRLEGVERR